MKYVANNNLNAELRNPRGIFGSFCRERINSPASRIVALKFSRFSFVSLTQNVSGGFRASHFFYVRRLRPDLNN